MSRRPLDFVFAWTCDRDRLISDVERICSENNLAIRDGWEIVKNSPKAPEWQRVVAEEEIAKDKKNVRGFLDALHNAMS